MKINDKFGKWTVLSLQKHSHSGKSQEKKILVRCDCGVERLVFPSMLKGGKSLQCKKCAIQQSYKGLESLSGYYFNQIKKGAESRSLSFEVDLIYLWKLIQKQNFQCALTNYPIQLDRHYGKNRKKDQFKQTASLDRIDSSKGYIKGNVQWVHKVINVLKMDLNQDRFIDLCNAVVNCNQNKPRVQVVSRLNIEGIHRWLKCPIEEVSYLKNYHRHIFQIHAKAYVSHSDRDIEFIQLSHQIKNYLHKKYFSTAHQCLFFDDMSCEMIADELVKKFNLSECEVNEDGEGGAIVKNL